MPSLDQRAPEASASVELEAPRSTARRCAGRLHHGDRAVRRRRCRSNLRSTVDAIQWRQMRQARRACHVSDGLRCFSRGYYGSFPEGMPMDRMAATEAFVRVVDAGSFSAAARQLHLGQPAISKTIAQPRSGSGCACAALAGNLTHECVL